MFCMASKDSNLSVCRHLNGEFSAHLVQIEIIFVLELTEFVLESDLALVPSLISPWRHISI